MVEKVYALGGSVFTENLDKLEQYWQAFGSEEQSVIVTGAGKLKENILAAEEIGNQAELDLIGIKATRLNAQTLSVALDSYPEIPETVDELRKAAESDQDVVMGGLVPGYSTDAVAATVAEVLEADLVIATSVDGVYDKDPEIEGAEKMESVSISELKRLTDGNNSAGKHDLIDSTALDIIERSNIETRVVLGTPENLKSSEFNGTRIVSEQG
ncbi:MAG: uridylate kinase [Candidatus Nanohaloarchaea archaeon]|jgi:uridylate kinase